MRLDVPRMNLAILAIPTPFLLGSISLLASRPRCSAASPSATTASRIWRSRASPVGAKSVSITFSRCQTFQAQLARADRASEYRGGGPSRETRSCAPGSAPDAEHLPSRAADESEREKRHGHL